MMNEQYILDCLITMYGLAKVQPYSIFPIGTSAYACDENGHVVGLKISKITKEGMDLVLQLTHLERLVLAAIETRKDRLIREEPQEKNRYDQLNTRYLTNKIYKLPKEIKNLKNIKFLWLADFDVLDPEILDLDLPIYLVGQQENQKNVPDSQLDLMSELKAQVNFTSQNNKYDDANANTNNFDKSVVGKYEKLEEIGEMQERKLEILAKRSPDWIQKSLSLEGIFVHGKYLEDPPPEIIKNGKNALKIYFQERHSSYFQLNEVKVILVGDGGSGKTSLVRQILGEEFNATESQTHGINIRSWSANDAVYPPVKIHMWDFGGQDIMHATHQFFLS